MIRKLCASREIVTSLIVSFLFVSTLPSLSQRKATEPQYIEITKETKWSDGVWCPVGTVELITHYKEQSYIIWHPNGNPYELPRANAKKVSAEDAAVKLLQHRQNLYKYVSVLENEVNRLKSVGANQPTGILKPAPQEAGNQSLTDEQQLALFFQFMELNKKVNGVAPPLNALNFLEGSKIIANDGAFLGIVSQNSFVLNSISNSYGQHGSDYAVKSIFNKFSKYGGDISNLSPFNSLAAKPPKIILANGQWAYLTKNKVLTPRIDTTIFISWLKSHQ